MLVFSVTGGLQCSCIFCASWEELEVAEMSWWSWTRTEIPSKTDSLGHSWGNPSFPFLFPGSSPSIRASRGWCTPAPSFHSTFRNSPSWICPWGAAAAAASVPPAGLQPAAFTSRFVGWASPGPAGPELPWAVPGGTQGSLCSASCRIPSSRAAASHNSSGVCPAHSGSEHPKLWVLGPGEGREPAGIAAWCSVCPCLVPQLQPLVGVRTLQRSRL